MAGCCQRISNKLVVPDFIAPMMNNILFGQPVLPLPSVKELKLVIGFGILIPSEKPTDGQNTLTLNCKHGHLLDGDGFRLFKQVIRNVA